MAANGQLAKVAANGQLAKVAANGQLAGKNLFCVTALAIMRVVIYRHYLGVPPTGYVGIVGPRFRQRVDCVVFRRESYSRLI